MRIGLGGPSFGDSHQLRYEQVGATFVLDKAGRVTAIHIIIPHERD